MPHELITIITTKDAEVRNRSLDGFCRTADAAATAGRGPRAGPLPPRQREPVRAGAGDLLPRCHLPLSPAGQAAAGRCGPRCRTTGYQHLLHRRFEEAIEEFLAVQHRDGPSDAIASALAAAYHALGFQTLADQVRRSVRSVRGNQWMFRIGPSRPTIRCRSAASCWTAAGPAAPFPILSNARRPHGPVAQRLERHLLPGHGFSRRGPRAERLGGPGRSRPRSASRGRRSRSTCA